VLAENEIEADGAGAMKIRTLVAVLLIGFALGSGTTALWIGRNESGLAAAEARKGVLGDSGAIATEPDADRSAVSGTQTAFNQEPVKPGNEDWDELMLQPVASDSELQTYLEEHERSREALVAVGQLTNDRDLLREAAERFPEDPMVQFLARKSHREKTLGVANS
jgi:hypothetical protein